MSLTEGRNRDPDQQPEAKQVPCLSALHTNCIALFDMRADHHHESP